MRRTAASTKAAILAAARTRFASEGYQKATIRAIAADAATDPALVMRYFGSKDKLFAAAAELDLGLPDLRGLDRAAVGAVVVRHFLSRWQDDDGLQILLRTGIADDAAAQRPRELFAQQLLPALAAVVPDRPAGRAALVASQVLGMALCRYLLKIPPAVQLSDDEVVRWLAPTVQRYLFDPDPPALDGR